MRSQPAIPLNSIVRFFLVGLAAFAISLWLWGRAFPAYLEGLTSVCNLLLSFVGLRESVEVHTLSYQSRDWIAVYASTYQQKRSHLFGFDIQVLQTHIPMFVALVIATRVRIFNRFKAIIIGTIGLSAVALLFVILTLSWSFFSIPEYTPYSPIQPPRSVTVVVEFLYYTFHLLLIHLAPVVIWGVTCFRLEELSLLLSRRAGRGRRSASE